MSLVKITSWVLMGCLACVGVPLAADRHLEYIPGGTLEQGDATSCEPGEGFLDERPVHAVVVASFYLENMEVSKALWDTVRTWALTNGYPDLAEGHSVAVPGPDADQHPAVRMTWYDAAKWCNARSAMEGLTPVYYTRADRNEIFRSGTNDVTVSAIDGTASGYRLPTESEWEWAARGLHKQAYYPWGGTGGMHTDHITPTQACYAATTTSPTGSRNANNHGLYDMAGNAAEWCWDWFDDEYYGSRATNAWVANPTGPEPAPLGGYRVTRGGSWHSGELELRCAHREGEAPSRISDSTGVRVARSFSEIADPDRDGDGMPDWWEFEHFGNKTNAVARADLDNDRLTNVEEYHAGTDPRDMASTLRIDAAVTDSDGWPAISWRSVSNRIYRVERSTNLLSGQFLPVAEAVPAMPPRNTLTDATNGISSSAFYRVRLRP